MANILDVARLAGVSPTTAKRAIREPDKLAPATLERVRAAIDELQYEPDRIAGALRRGSSSTVGLVIGNVVEPFFASLVRTVGSALRERGYGVLVADNEYSAELEIEILRELHGQRVRGLIVRSGYVPPDDPGENLAYLERMARRGTAVVEIDHLAPDSPFSHVMLDNRAAVEEGVAHLAALGHRRIAALGDHHPFRNPEERSREFPRVMAAMGLPLPDPYRRYIPFLETEGYALTRDLLALPEPPTALFALTGTLAAGAYRAIRDAGLRAPDDVSLLAFDDYPWTSLVEPGITVLAQPVEAMGRAAVGRLFELMEGEGGGEAVRQRFAARLIVRGSTGAPPLSAS